MAPSRDEPDEAFYRLVVIIGKPNDISDLCLFWSLRACRGWYSAPFPLWIPYGAVKQTTVANLLRGAMARMSSGRGFVKDESVINVLSTSVDGGAIASFWPSDAGSIRVASSIEPYFARPLRYSAVKEGRQFTISSGRLLTDYPSSDELRRFFPQEPVAYELQLDGIVWPSNRHISDSFWGTMGTRVTREGVLSIDHWEAPADSMWTVNAPRKWEVLKSVFAEAGFTIAPSDKGKMAAGILNHMKDAGCSDLLIRKRVYELLKKMAVRKGAESKRRYLAERSQFSFDHLKKQLGEGAQLIVERLIDGGIVQRGAEVSCRTCGVSLWQELDALKQIWVCPGCKTSQAIPLPLPQVNWKYTINSLYAFGFDQGALLHAIHAYNAVGLWKPTVVFYPGLVAKSQIPGLQEIDLDVVRIDEGKVVISECKEPRGRLSNEQIDRLASAADRLKADIEIVTPGKLPDDTSSYLDRHLRNFTVVEGDRVFRDPK